MEGLFFLSELLICTFSIVAVKMAQWIKAPAAEPDMNSS